MLSKFECSVWVLRIYVWDVSCILMCMYVTFSQCFAFWFYDIVLWGCFYDDVMFIAYAAEIYAKRRCTTVWNCDVVGWI